jgi:protein phosphatase
VSTPPASQGNWQSSAAEPNTWHQLSDIQFEHVAGIFIGGRSGQEDSIGLLGPARTNAESVFVVCDGMGGEKGGARASGLVRDSLLQGYAAERARRSPDQAMRACIERAHQSILQIGAAEPEFASMGTTVVSLATNGRTVWHAHSGDSRLYEFEQGELKRRTKDHTRVQRMIDENIVPKDVAEKLPDAHVLSHAVGRGELRVDCGMFDLEDRPRRTYLLASDGLHGVVSDEIISKAMAGFDAGRAVRILMEMIRALEGSDNTSVIVLRFGPQAREGDEAALFQQAADEAGKRISVTLTNGTGRTFAPRRKTPKDGIPVHRYTASESEPAKGKKWLSKLNIGLGVLLLCAVAAAAVLSRKPTKAVGEEGSGAPTEAKAGLRKGAEQGTSTPAKQQAARDQAVCTAAVESCTTAKERCDAAGQDRLDLDGRDKELDDQMRASTGTKKQQLRAQLNALRSAEKKALNEEMQRAYQSYQGAKTDVAAQCYGVDDAYSAGCTAVEPQSLCERGTQRAMKDIPVPPSVAPRQAPPAKPEKNETKPQVTGNSGAASGNAPNGGTAEKALETPEGSAPK